MSREDEEHAIDRLLGQLRFDFPDLPEQLLLDMTVEAAREMAKCGLLQLDIDITQDLQSGVSDYDYSDYLPEGYDVNCVESVEFCGCCIDPVDPKCNPCANGYEICGLCAIRLHPCPSAAPGQTLELCLSLTPNANSCQVPGSLAVRYPSILRNLARGEIYCLPNQPFSDLRAATRYRDKGRVELRTEAEKINPKGTPSTRPKVAQGRGWL